MASPGKPRVRYYEYSVPPWAPARQPARVGKQAIRAAGPASGSCLLALLLMPAWPALWLIRRVATRGCGRHCFGPYHCNCASRHGSGG